MLIEVFTRMNKNKTIDLIREHNEKILDRIREEYEQLPQQPGIIKHDNLPNKTIAGLFDPPINEKTFSSGLSKEDYLATHLKSLYKTLCNHKNIYYRSISRIVLDICNEEHARSLGILQSEIMTASIGRIYSKKTYSNTALGINSTSPLMTILSSIFSIFSRPKKEPPPQKTASIPLTMQSKQRVANYLRYENDNFEMVNILPTEVLDFIAKTAAERDFMDWADLFSSITNDARHTFNDDVAEVLEKRFAQLNLI